MPAPAPSSSRETPTPEPFGAEPPIADEIRASMDDVDVPEAVFSIEESAPH